MADSSIPEPNYSFWDVFDEFTLDQAAYLLCDTEPGNGYGAPPKVSAIRGKLYDAIESGELPCKTSGGIRVIREPIGVMGIRFRETTVSAPTIQHITRTALKGWEIAKRLKPKSLFPEMREPRGLIIEQIAEAEPSAEISEETAERVEPDTPPQAGTDPKVSGETASRNHVQERRDILAAMLDEIERRTAEQGTPFDRGQFPGTKDEFREFAKRYNPRLDALPTNNDRLDDDIKPRGVKLLQGNHKGKGLQFFKTLFPELYR